MNSFHGTGQPDFLLVETFQLLLIKQTIKITVTGFSVRPESQTFDVLRIVDRLRIGTMISTACLPMRKSAHDYRVKSEMPIIFNFQQTARLDPDILTFRFWLTPKTIIHLCL